MGYYFPKAKTTADLTSKQKERYKALRSEGVELPQQLEARYHEVKESIGPITGGEAWSALEELWQDAVVCWVLSGEDPDLVWVDPEYAKDERTPQELQRDKEAWEATLSRWKEETLRKEREYDEWQKENEPARYYFRKLSDRWWKLFDSFRESA